VRPDAAPVGVAAAAVAVAKRHRKPPAHDRDYARPTLLRVIQKAGIPSAMGPVYPKLRRVLTKDFDAIVRDALTLMDYERKKIMQPAHLRRAASDRGYRVLG
jgi:hypothetical protein